MKRKSKEHSVIERERKRERIIRIFTSLMFFIFKHYLIVVIIIKYDLYITTLAIVHTFLTIYFGIKTLFGG